jgi:hypothetical protein
MNCENCERDKSEESMIAEPAAHAKRNPIC